MRHGSSGFAGTVRSARFRLAVLAGLGCQGGSLLFHALLWKRAAAPYPGKVQPFRSGLLSVAFAVIGAAQQKNASLRNDLRAAARVAMGLRPQSRSAPPPD